MRAESVPPATTQEHDPTTGSVRAPHDRAERQSLARWTRSQTIRAGDADPEERRSIHGSVTLAHLWLADSVARRFIGKGEDLDDLQQVARAALVEAVGRYDPDQGDFIPFAVPTIAGLLKRHFRDHAWPIRPPRRTQEIAVTIRREWPTLAQSLGHQPTTRDLADHLDCDETDIRRAQVADRGYGSESLDDDSAGQGRRLQDGEPARSSDAALVVRRACAGLDREDRWLLYLRFAEERTQSDIAQRLGTSQMQVSRRLARLLRRMRSSIGPLDAPSSRARRSASARTHATAPAG